MKWEELTTPEAVMAAFEAGRRVEFTWGPNSGFIQIGKSQCPVADIADELSSGNRYRALIEDAPPIPKGFTPWAGGECPDDVVGKRTRAILRGGEERDFRDGSAYRWRHCPEFYEGNMDIIAYRVEQPERQGEAADYSQCCDTPAYCSSARRCTAQDGAGGSLHPATADLVRRFSAALAEKLAAAEKKYGYSDGWASPDWMDECRSHLLEHVRKGDPRDVAAYCAFLWHHGERTSPQPIPVESLGRDADDGVEALAAEGLDYFERAGDAGDRKYVQAIREILARRLRPTVDEAMVERATVGVHESRRPYTCRGLFSEQDDQYQARIRRQARAALTAALTTSPEADNG